MQTHKFKVGQSLLFSPARYEYQRASGLIEVTRLLPAEGTELQYRIKDTSSGQERVVRESQLCRP
jgi:hypothetical protein